MQKQKDIQKQKSTKRKKSKIIIIVVIILLCCAALIAGGTVLYRKYASNKVNTFSVTDLNVGDWQNSSTMSGTITNSAMQEITLQDDKKVGKVYVKDGDSVKKGDKLFKYDMTLSELELESDKLNKQTMELKEKTLKDQIANPKKYLTEEYSAAGVTDTAQTSGTGTENADEDGAAAEDDGIAEEEQVIVITQAEINEYVAEKQSELRETQLEIAKSELEISRLEKTLKNKVVKSKIDGTVMMGEESSDIYMTVQGNEGLYVKGSLSEYMLGEVSVGDIVNGEDYYTGETFEAEIQSISEYPEESSGDMYGMGGSADNVSYYGFSALISEDLEASVGDDVELTFQDEVSEDAIFLEKAFVRSENGKSYVFVQGKDKKLKKQTVELGKTVEGTVVEIKDGITLDDRIAFPYGKDVKEGARTKNADIDALYE